MKILFLGGTGRLSKDLALYSAEQGDDVYLLTRNSGWRDVFVDSRYHMITGNVRNEEECKALLDGRSFDVVVDFLTLNLDHLKTTLNIVYNKCRQYIFISSATVYHRQDENEVFSEDRSQIGDSIWSYVNNKVECERYLNASYSCDEHFRYTIIRPYVTYGNTRITYPIVPPKAWQEWSFIQRVENGQPIPRFDSGRTVTTLMHTRDFAKASYGLFLNEAAYGEAVHITPDTTTTWGKVLECVENKLGKKVEVVDMTQKDIYSAIPFYRDILLGDKGQNMLFDNSKMKRLVPEFQTEITLQEGVDEMIDFYNTHPEMKKINYEWNGAIDRLCKSKGYKLSYKYEFPDYRSRLEYYKGRFPVVGKLAKPL